MKSGTWQYDECVSHEVWIVKQNFDFYFDEGFEDAPEDLNEDGEVFQVVVAKDGNVRSVGLLDWHFTRLRKRLQEPTKSSHRVLSG